jgi:hypothetical protein
VYATTWNLEDIVTWELLSGLLEDCSRTAHVAQIPQGSWLRGRRAESDYRVYRSCHAYQPNVDQRLKDLVEVPEKYSDFLSSYSESNYSRLPVTSVSSDIF